MNCAMISDLDTWIPDSGQINLDSGQICSDSGFL